MSGRAAPALGVYAALLAALWASTPTHAALWTLESTLQMRAEYNDNLSLLARSAGAAHRLTVEPALNASVQSENAITRVEAGLNLLAAANLQDRRNADGRLSLSQTVSDPLNNYSAGLTFSQSDTFGNRQTASDVLVGRTRRTAYGATASWSHSFTERLSAQSGFAWSDTTYAGSSSGPATDANDFRDRAVNVGLNYRWDELSTLGLRASRSYYAATSGASSSVSDSLRLSASRALTERTSLSFSVGGYRTQGSVQGLALVCPLAQALCDAGVVAPILVALSRDTNSRGTLFDTSLDWSVDERTALAASASSELSPSGVGVVQSRRAAVSVSRSFSPTWRGAASLSESSSSQPGPTDRQRPRLRTLDASMNWSLAEDLTLSVGGTLKHFNEPRAGTRATSNALSLTLQYQGPKLFAHRQGPAWLR